MLTVVIWARVTKTGAAANARSSDPPAAFQDVRLDILVATFESLWTAGYKMRALNVILPLPTATGLSPAQTKTLQYGSAL